MGILALFIAAFTLVHRSVKLTHFQLFGDIHKFACQKFFLDDLELTAANSTVTLVFGQLRYDLLFGKIFSELIFAAVFTGLLGLSFYNDGFLCRFFRSFIGKHFGFVEHAFKALLTVTLQIF